jgi:nitroimidazol reductase NimA-like FMN-containing flavoprotein (pyridoxamine 5'-phosphate oxidase superfamily)
MIETLSPRVRRVLEEGAVCHVAASTPHGPHVTPMVFATAGGRLWVTTSRRSVKARAWRRDPRVAGSVRAGDDGIAFTGTAQPFDVLDVATWSRSIIESPLIALAALRFTRKNARFFAGYAVDANHVPLAWTPPGRVFAELRPERIALLEGDRVSDAWGEWPEATESIERFRAPRTGRDPLAALPPDVVAALGRTGFGALALQAPEGPVVLPVSWAAEGAAVYAALGTEIAALAGCASRTAASLCIERPSSWRAGEMVGAMVRGEAEIAAVDRLASGGRSAAGVATLAGLEASGSAVVRLHPRSLVWWHGWSSGTVRIP